MKLITLATLSSATAQEVYDQAVAHLRKQGKQALDGRRPGNSCKYRHTDKDGTVLMCAAGCFISEEEYNPEMEGKGWYTIIAKGYVSSKHQELIVDLQTCHDAYPVSDWEYSLERTAKRFGLVYTAP